jgi:hypothetical protein
LEVAVGIVAELPRVDRPDSVIAEVRRQVTADSRAYTDHHVEAWCARRWRFLFLKEAVKDPVALDYATLV